jgi:hypothetical protein
LDEFRYVLNRDPLYQDAINLMVKFYKQSKSPGQKLQAIWSDLQNAENDIVFSIKTNEYEEKVKALREASNKLNNGKLPILGKLAEEQMELIMEQKKLEENPSNARNRQFIGLSVSDTLKMLIKDSKHEPKLGAAAVALAKKFKVPDKRFYRIKIKALAQTKQWDALHKFSQEKKNPPCGFKAFAVACLEMGEKSQAESYTARITAADEKFETLIHLEMYQDALQLAIKLKDPEKLTSVRNLCGDVDICNQADKAAVELGFVS